MQRPIIQKESKRNPTIKEAKNQSILKIEESRKDLTSAKILNKIKELSVDEIKSGSDDISKKIREISLIIKDRAR